MDCFGSGITILNGIFVTPANWENAKSVSTPTKPGYFIDSDFRMWTGEGEGGISSIFALDHFPCGSKNSVLLRETKYARKK